MVGLIFDQGGCGSVDELSRRGWVDRRSARLVAEFFHNQTVHEIPIGERDALRFITPSDLTDHRKAHANAREHGETLTSRMD